MYDAKIARKKQIRRLAGNARARLNTELREQYRLIRRAARADLREDIRRLEARREEYENRSRGLVARDRNDDQRGDRVNNIPARQGASNVDNTFQRVPSRQMESGGRNGARGVMGNDRNTDQSGGRVNRFPGSQGESSGTFHRVQDENGGPSVARDGSRVWSMDPRIRRVQEQQQQQELREQRTVEYVRRIRQENQQHGGQQQAQLQQGGQSRRQQDQHHQGHHPQQQGTIPQNQHGGGGSQEHHRGGQPSHSHSNQAGPSCQAQEEVRCNLTRARLVKTKSISIFRIFTVSFFRSFTLVIERTESQVW